MRGVVPTIEDALLKEALTTGDLLSPSKAVLVGSLKLRRIVLQLRLWANTIMVVGVPSSDVNRHVDSHNRSHLLRKSIVWSASSTVPVAICTHMLLACKSQTLHAKHAVTMKNACPPVLQSL